MRDKKEKGAIVVEATLCLTAFVFALIMILMLVNIAYAQAKIGTALDYATKEISQYSYLYFKLGIDEWDSNISEGTEDATELSHQTVDGIVSLTNNISSGCEDVQTGDFDGLVSEIESGGNTVETLYNNYGDRIKENPSGFAMSMGQLAVSELKEEAKVVLGQLLAKSFMEKNLKSFGDEDPDNFLKRMNIKEGLDGLDFDGSYLMPAGSGSIQMVCSYEIHVLELLNVDFSFKFTQCAKTTAWGNGVSLITEKSIWDTMGPLDRGRFITSQKKKNFPYTASRSGFDAYDNRDGKNEFISVFSIDNITSSTYQDVSGVQDRLDKEFNNMYSRVSRMSDQITVTNSNGEKETIHSDVDTRTYRLYIVIPDGADESVINQAISAFKSEHPDQTIECTVVHGYGTPATNDDSSDSDSNG